MISLSVSPSIKGRYNPLNVEEWVIEFWNKNNIYMKVKEKASDPNKPLFAFLEGPPTANGFMHVGHARGRTFKDIMLRYKRMKGFRVWDQAGWDTQGLPVEIEVERNLGFKTKKDIEKYGVNKFIMECQKLVDYYIDHWRKASERLGLWLDYDHAYETRDPRYLDSAWTFLKTMWDKGLLYEDLRVIPICPRCETALSSHEVALGSMVVKDPSLYFKLKLIDEENTYMVAWTTTPWTIIANEALAVHPDEYYVKVKVGNEYWIIAEKRLESVFKEINIASYEVVARYRGRDLLGKKYIHPLLDEVPAHKEHNGKYEHAVIVADWVSMEEGTGIVHMAPAHGPEDFEEARKYNIRVFNPLAKNGYFTELAGKYAGLWFKDASKQVVKDLHAKGLVAHFGWYEHEYPHCWRCDTPLIYYADRQWFIRVEPIKKAMIEENKKVAWYPEWARKRFGDWLENARDWCISRERYWGTPLPIWTCSKCKYRMAFGSLEEVKKHALNPEVVIDHHRPWIDKVIIKCPKCGGLMQREPYVVDVWMDSGVAHTASLHQYGWDNKFKELFPYTWITEAVDQTRGWFYTLMFTSVAWHGSTPYKAVLNQGHVLDKYGKKMSKSRGNVIWALEFMEKHGADLLRLYLTVKAAPWDNMNFDPDEIVLIKRQLDILWNSVNFALTYMQLDKWTPERIEEDLRHLEPVDKWIITELDKTIRKVEESLELNNLHIALRTILDFIVEKLSHRYITLIRPRVWIEVEDPSKRAVYATLFIVISSILKVLAPFAPFIAEYIYQAFTRKLLREKAKESIHLEDWPTVPRELVDEDTWRRVTNVLKVSEAILTVRSSMGIKRRWPLKKLVLIVNKGEEEAYRRCINIIKIYANIKEVVIQTEEKGIENLVKLDVKELPAFLDTVIDKELLLEGLAREIVRRIQVIRKELNLPLDKVVNRIVIHTPDNELKEAIKKFKDYILRETRASDIMLSEKPIANARKWNIENKQVLIYIEV